MVQRNRFSPVLFRPVAFLLVFLSVVPVARIVYILATTGANNQSSDDIHLLHEFVSKALQGGYHWRSIFHDTFHNTHSNVVPGLIYLVFARLFHLNVYSLLYFGVALAAAKLLLLHDAFTREFKQNDRLVRLLLWAVMSALVFSVAQMSTFELDLQTVKTGVCELGLAATIWGLVRFPRRSIAVCIATAGALAASFSFATGLIIWPLAIGAMVLLGFRKLRHYLLCICGAAFSIGVYVYFLLGSKRVAADDHYQGLLRIGYVLRYIGAPFAYGSNDEASQVLLVEIFGAFGLSLLLIGLALLYRKSGQRSVQSAAAPLMLSTFAVASAWQVSLFRELWAPWYTTFAIDFWLGLVGMSFVLWSLPGSRTSQSVGSRFRLAARGVAIVSGLFICFCYVPANWAHSDKSLFLATRAPVSAACLRSYATAPTFCDEALVKWPAIDYRYTSELGTDLQKNRLSVFAPNQEWTLQGDTILDTVRYAESAGVPRIGWTVGLDDEVLKPSDFRHLNLFVPTPDSVDWTVSLPSSVTAAEFHSAVAICKDAPVDPNADGVTFDLYVFERQTGKKLFTQHLDSDDRRWHPFSLNLGQYAGRTITIRLASEMGQNLIGDWPMYRYPKIDVSLPDDVTEALSQTIAPSNTDLSPEFRGPDAGDFRFDADSSRSWQAEDMVLASGSDEPGPWRIEGSNPTLIYKARVNEEIANYSEFCFEASLTAPSEDLVAAVRVYYMLDDDRRFSPSRMFTVPLLSGAEAHQYTYPIRLLALNTAAHLIGVKIVPLSSSDLRGKATFSLFGFSLLKKKGSGVPQQPDLNGP